MEFFDKEKYDRAKKAIKKAGLDAIFVRLPENVLYFSNWWPITGWGAAIIFAESDPVLFTPSTESMFAKRRIIDDMREYNANGPQSLFNEIKKLDCALKPWKIGVELTFEHVASTHLGYELSIPNSPFFNQLKEAMPKWHIENAIPTINELRAIKSQFDYENFAFVNELNAFGLQAASTAVQEEKTEIEIAGICERAINEKIGDYQEKVDFIRAYAFVMAGSENGSRAGWPYNISTAYKMKKGELCMLELNTQVNGYWSDLTRTWVVGHKPSDSQNDMLNTINNSISEAMKIIRPGLATYDLDKTIQKSIMKTKWGKYYNPFTGHGIGWSTHESIPMIYPGAPGTLQQGHYFSVEPGIYGKEILGALRIERDVWLGPNGPVFTDKYPCEL